MQVKFVLLIGAFLGPFAGNAVIALFEPLKNDFGVSSFIVFLSVTLFMIPYALMQVFSGSVADLFERQKVVAAGFYVYAIGSLICAISPNMTIFLGARILQGFGSAFIFPAIMAIIGDTAPFERRGEAMGFLGSASALGVATGPLIAGFFAVTIGWRWIFLLIFLLSLIIGILFLTTFEDTRKINESKFDINKIFKLIKEALSETSVRLLGICAFLMFFSYIAALTFTSDYVGEELSMKADKIGVILFSAGIAPAIVAIPAGKLVDIIGRLKVILNGFTIMIIAFILLRFADSFTRFVILFFLLGCGTGTAWPALNTLAVELIPEKRATVSSLYNSFRFGGYAASPILLAPIYLQLSITYIYLTCASIVLLNILIASILCSKFIKR